jgi:hypothetical protein
VVAPDAMPYTFPVNPSIVTLAPAAIFKPPVDVASAVTFASSPRYRIWVAWLFWTMTDLRFFAAATTAALVPMLTLP